jgi:CBS-domain-containing membrane protein
MKKVLVIGGGGHAKAASTTVRLTDENQAEVILQNLVDELISTSLLKQPPVGDFMTAPVLSAKPEMTEKEVDYLFNRFDVRALPVVDDNNNVIGLVTFKEVAAAKQRLVNKEQKREKEKEAREKAKAKNKMASNKDASTTENDNSKAIEKRRKLGSALKGWMLQHVTVVEASKTLSDVETLLLDNDGKNVYDLRTY